MDARTIPLFHEISREVHPDDEMFKTAKVLLPNPIGKAANYYFYSGGLVATTVAEFLRQRGAEPSQLSMLDFACGFGRITRYFVKIFGEVVGSDLEPTMVEFIKKEMGVEGFLSNVDLAKVEFPPRQFDVVFSFSLFTHLNPEIWEDWFWAAFERVKPGGHMFFSTRGVEFARRVGEQIGDDEAIRFTEKNETRGRLDVSVYGQTTIAREFVDGVIAKRPHSAERLAYFKGGEFDTYQDMHVLRRI